MKASTVNLENLLAVARSVLLVVGLLLLHLPAARGQAELECERNLKLSQAEGRLKDHYQFPVEYGEGATKTAAINDARDRMRKRLETQREDLSLRSKAFLASVNDEWKTATWKQKLLGEQRYGACVVGGYDAEIAAKEEAAQRGVELQLQALGAELAQSIRDGRALQGGTFLEPVRWVDSECVAAGLSEEVRLRLEAGMRKASLASLDARAAAPQRLELTASEFGESSVRVYAVLLSAAVPGQRQHLGYVEFPRAWVELRRNACFSAKRLEPTSSPPVSNVIPSLTLKRAASPFTGELCDGEGYSVELSASSAARLRLYSVEKSGRAWQIWPGAGQSDGVEAGSGRTVKLGVERDPAGGDERLVLLAIPPQASWGIVETWLSVCELGKEQLESLLALPAGRVSVTYYARPAGVGGCPAKASQTLVQERDVYPTCR